MILLTSISDAITVVTSAISSIDVHASWLDNVSGVITPGRTNTATISTATTTTVVAAPLSSTQRNVKTIFIRNRHATVACDVTVKHTDGTNNLELFKTTLQPGEELIWSWALGLTQFLASGAPKTSDSTNVSITGGTISGADINLKTGTTAAAGLTFPTGTLVTTPALGDLEFDGKQLYGVIDVTSGRGAIPIEQYFHLTADGSNITTIANFFGTTSNISLVASAYYEIEIFLWYVMTGTGDAVTFTLTNSAAPTSQNIHWELSPAAGIVSAAAATALLGAFLNDATAARTIVTPSLTTGTSQYARIRIFLKNGTGTSLKVQATTTNAITPKIGSWWRCTRRSDANVGTFAA